MIIRTDPMINKDRWFEVDASKRGSHYFNKKYGDESKSYKDEYSKDPYGVDKTKYFSIKSFINGGKTGQNFGALT